MEVTKLLHFARSEGASDLHLVVSRPPILRINGTLQPINELADLTEADVEIAFSQIAAKEEREAFQKSLELDFSYSIPEIMRVRCSASKQRKTLSLSLRIIPWIIPTFDELHLPDICKYLVTRPRGLVIISGPTGSGKTTTLAAMIDHLNDSANLRIETVEDPIEYVYMDNKCTITQRQIGVDTYSFSDALKHVLRHDPDVILVGELRDAETVAAVLNLAETGHLVLTTGHAPSASQTIDRIIDLFPPSDRFLAQSRISSLLVGVLCQILVPTATNDGRIPAVEVMLANPAIKNLIRDGKIYQLDNTIRSNAQAGMVLMDHSLVDLYRRKFITFDTVQTLCNDRAEIDRLLNEVMVK